MSFLFFYKKTIDNKLRYSNAYDNFSLAGYNLIYHSWIKKGKPVNIGWSVNADELIRLYGELNNESDCNGDEYALIIDFHPSSKNRIGIVEIERIHLFTHGIDAVAHWTPMMLELRGVFYEEEIEDFTPELKQSILENIDLQPDRQKIVEFLYLNGDEYSWNWGKNGMTNAVFLEENSRNYFRQFF